ncbi:hypothetical protein AHAS_Ahas18G0189000 [Arachis hypogaea]
MAQNVESCLNSWKLNKILSLTVDNASSNDVGVMYLQKRSSYVTSNLYMKEVFARERRIQQYRDDDDLSISHMASKMKAKYNKYWANAKPINMLLIAIVLDPCHKLG